MVSYLGMSPSVGNISFYDSTESSGFNIGKPYSEKTAELIDNEAKRLVDESYVTAKRILTEHMEGFTKLAELLLEKEVIFSEDLEKIFGKRAGSQPPTASEQIIENEHQQEIEQEEKEHEVKEQDVKEQDVKEQEVSKNNE